MKLIAAWIAILSSFVISRPASSQLNATDSSFYTAAIRNTLTLYYRSAGDQSRLYNGSQYTGYSFTFREGQPFFGADQPMPGTIVYDDIFFDSVLLQYDEVKEAVIFTDANHRIQLINEKISRFTLVDKQFIRITKDSMNNMSTGFYHVLYSGKTGILKKESKSIQEQVTNSQGIQRLVITHVGYYLLKGTKFYTLRKKSDIFEILKDKKNELQGYMRANKLKFRKNKESFFSKLAFYYDSITR